MTHIASVFDSNYIVRAAAFYDSVKKFVPDAKLWFLCLDEKAIDLGRKLFPDAQLMRIEDLGDTELLATRAGRTEVEFAMTSKPPFLAHLVNSGKVPKGDFLILSDVDILFFAPIAPLLDTLKKSGDCVFITPHRFPPKKEYLADLVGFYNSGFIIFKVEQRSIDVLNDWRRRTIEWCFLWHDLENKRHTDQRYLNEWKQDHTGVFDLTNKGVNLGSWNVAQSRIARRATDAVTGTPHFSVDGEELICYHYHGFKFYLKKNGSIAPYPITVKHPDIYSAYVHALQDAYGRITKIVPDWHGGFAKSPGILRLIKQRMQNLLRR